MNSLQIYIDHRKLIRFEELALEIAECIESKCQFEININPDKTKAIINIMMINYQPRDIVYYIEPSYLEEFRMLALDFAKASNSGIKINVRFNETKTKAISSIELLGINNT